MGTAVNLHASAGRGAALEKVPLPPSPTAQSPGPVPPQEVTQAISDPGRAWQGASAVGPCSLPGPGNQASTDSRPRDHHLPVLPTPHRADPQPPKFTDRTPRRSWAQEPSLQRQAPARPLLDPPLDARPQAPRAAVKQERAMCSQVPFPQSLGSVHLSVHWMGACVHSTGLGHEHGPRNPSSGKWQAYPDSHPRHVCKSRRCKPLKIPPSASWSCPLLSAQTLGKVVFFF